MKREPRLSPEAAGTKTRRDFLRLGGMLAAGAALAGPAIPPVHAAEDNTIRLALIGSGSRGSGAVVNAFESPNGPCKLVAMADIFANRLKGRTRSSANNPQQVDVPPERGSWDSTLHKSDRSPAARRRHRHADTYPRSARST